MIYTTEKIKGLARKTQSCKHSDVYGDDDLDSVLLGGDDSAGDGDFNPFDSGLGTDDEPIDSRDYGYGPDTEPDDTDTLGGLYRASGEIGATVTRHDDESFPWERGSQPTTGDSSARERAAASAGDRNVRRTAEQRTGNSGTGVARKQRSESVADSIVNAQRRIREQSQQPLDDGERESVVKNIESQNASPHVKPKRIYTKSQVTDAPSFGATNFEATIIGLKANTNGEWIVQFKVPATERDSTTVLGDAYGLALKVTVERKIYGND